MKKLLSILLLIFCSMFLNAQQSSNVKTRNVAIFLYPEAELLDFAGPQEVLTKTEVNGESPFNVYVVAVDTSILSIQSLNIKPQYTLANCPKPDIIIIPGGDSRKVQNDLKVIQWVKENSEGAEITMSVCSGVSVLLKAGLLDGKDATTHHGAIDKYAGLYKTTKFHKKTRFVDNGNVITTAGVSAGIDGTLHLVEKLFGRDFALETVSIMEYDKWEPDKGLIIGK